MALNGIDQVTFGVADMAEAKRFLDDWGVTPVSESADRLHYKTRDGSDVIVRKAGDPSLPAGIEPGNTLRELIWGADSQAELDKALATLRTRATLTVGADGIARTVDPNGLTIGFRVSTRKPIAAEATQVNAPGAPRRIDQRSPIHQHAHPIGIGHIVVFATDIEALRSFYIDGLGFSLSDEYPGHGYFLRCQVEGEHHNLFMLNRPGKPGINHVAFTLTDIHEVIGGGIAMSKKGWKTEIGPGRHPISSAYFWYFENPLCAPLEYYADEDHCTAKWKPQKHERKPENFAEWAIAGGIDGTTRRQVVAQDNSGRGHA